MKEVIMQVPSFSADYPKAPIYVADLVRCKECKHYKPKQKGKPWSASRLYCTKGTNKTTDPNDYCSYGEREGE